MPKAPSPEPQSSKLQAPGQALQGALRPGSPSVDDADLGLDARALPRGRLVAGLVELPLGVGGWHASHGLALLGG